jgi:hypothetical protein
LPADCLEIEKDYQKSTRIELGKQSGIKTVKDLEKFQKQPQLCFEEDC